MGNKNVIINTQHSKLRKFLKSTKSRNCKTESKSNDDFIIKHFQNNKVNDRIIDSQSFDIQKRTVFISLIGLYQSWRNVPSLTLYSSLLIMPLHQKWIYHPSEYMDELQSSFISQCNIFSDVSEIKTFIQLLKWKDSQGLVLWMLDDCNMENNDIDMESPPIHPFWHCMSRKLESLYDCVSRTNYKPLHISAEWWKNKKTSIYKYDTTTSNILKEICCLTMKYKPIQEIIYESNPDSLHPVITYDSMYSLKSNHSMKQLTNKELLSIYDDDEDIDDHFDYNEQNEDIWFVSEDYVIDMSH